MTNDQAEALRNLVRQEERGRMPVPGTETPDRQTRIFTITSGKGGVGKSNFTLNFALQLQSLGYQVLVFDADIGMANIDVLMGVSPKYNLYHLLKREKTIEEIICRGYNDLQFIAGGSGFNDLLSLKPEELEYFSSQVMSLSGTVDFILFDTGAGLSKESLKFITAAEQTIVVTTPEPTSITDAYAIIKMVHAREPSVRFQLVVNRVTDRLEGKQTADKIRLVSQQFLQLDIPTLGYIPDDANVSKAVKKQTPFSVMFPETAATRELKELVRRFESSSRAPLAEPSMDAAGGVKRFLSRMLSFMR
ncbi:MinD/ParA family protein [Paenibacillus sp.]|uniref:MinD/ParA family protein n=1 Tax=Paenibacillus sp. TaxID=58172 RepID=UPI002D2D0031|nr:MinD/ParA family protein [Paenibacillus sp.]HZG84381.1 MinD/ParA family protein [Paenibacillus sp.]